MFPLAFRGDLVFTIVNIRARKRFGATVTTSRFFLAIERFKTDRRGPFTDNLFLVMNRALSNGTTRTLFLLQVNNDGFYVWFRSNGVNIHFLGID